MSTNFINSWGNGVTRTSSGADGGAPWNATTVTKTFSSGAGTGNVGTVALFTVTGCIRGKLIARCTTNMAGATATIEVGVTGSTAGLIAQTTATNLIAPELWNDTSPDKAIELMTTAPEYIINGNIFVTVGTANLTGGVIEFTLLWSPVSTNGAVVSA